MWMPSPPRQILTFDLQNLIRLSVGVDEYFLSVLRKMSKPFFVRYSVEIELNELGRPLTAAESHKNEDSASLFGCNWSSFIVLKY